MIIPVNGAQANFRFEGSSLPTGAEITLGFNIELFTGDPTDLISAIATNWAAANFDELYTTDTILDSVLVKFGPNSTGPSAEGSVLQPGAAGGGAAAPNTAYLIRKNTGFGGRTGRGRMYFPGVPEGQVDQAGVVSSAWAGSMTTAWETFRTDMSTAGAVPVLLHAPGSPVSTPMPITSFVCDSRVATQRRRLRR